MKFAVTPFNVSSIKPLSKSGADIFIIGNEKFANRLVYSFSTIEITNANKIIKELNKELYIVVNIIMHNEHIQDIKDFFDFIKTLDVDGIIFADLGIYVIAKKMGLESKLIYNPETLNTSTYDPIFWTKKAIKGLTISKEITLDEINQISKQGEIEISLIGHGFLNMFHSRRPLIENFFKYTNEEYKKFIENQNLKIVEEIRNEAYPLFQDLHGTHIFREKALESYKEIINLRDSLDVFIIDGILKNSEYLKETLKNYVALVEKEDPTILAGKLSKLYEKDHDSGFLYKKTVYDKF
jgi:putative protease